MTNFLRKLTELNVDFLGLESQVFSLDLGYSVRALYNSLDIAMTQQTLQLTSKKVKWLVIKSLVRPLL